MNKKNKRNKTLIIFTTILLIIMVIGATFAYFTSQLGNGTNTNINAITGTTDSLKFSADDKGIDISANEENFGINENNISDTTYAIANLKANNTSNVAKAKYNVYLIIDANTLKYTAKDTNIPELVMKITKPDKTELKEIPGLLYHEKSERENDVSGFDITGKIGAYVIAKGYEIEVTELDNGEKEQKWNVEVTLINLATDQNENTGKSVKGQIVITSEEKDTYKLNHINSITTESTEDSITTTLNLEKGATNKIKEYYFGKEEI